MHFIWRQMREIWRDGADGKRKTAFGPSEQMWERDRERKTAFNKHLEPQMKSTEQLSLCVCPPFNSHNNRITGTG